MPPLNALKAFEAAARYGGYVAAARELGVSPSAVSQQVRNLERFFGKQLFARYNNRVALTDAGITIYADTARALQDLASMTTRVLEGELRPLLVVSVLPSLAHRWFHRRLAEFLLTDEQVRIDLRVEDDPVDFARQDIDLRICYGAHLYPDLAVVPLLHDEVVPLCTSSFWNRHGTSLEDLSELSDELLIHTSWGPSFASHPTWADWFASIGKKRAPDVAKGHRVPMSSLAIDLAVAGAGICLGQRMLAEDELATGRLVSPWSSSLPLGHPYCAVHPHTKAHKQDLSKLKNWLLRA